MRYAEAFLGRGTDVVWGWYSGRSFVSLRTDHVSPRGARCPYGD